MQKEKLLRVFSFNNKIQSLSHQFTNLRMKRLPVSETIDHK